MKISTRESLDLYLDQDEYPNLSVTVKRQSNYNIVKFFKNPYDEHCVTLHLSNGQIQKLKKELNNADDIRSTSSTGNDNWNHI